MLDNIGPLGRQKHIFFILLRFNDNNVLSKYFHIFCSGRAFQRYMDHDNPSVISNIAIKNIFTLSNFWTDYNLSNNRDGGG